MKYDTDDAVELPKTFEAWEEGGDEGDLEDALDNDLCSAFTDRLDDRCESGGFPDDEQVQIDGVSVDGDTLTARVTVHFTEVVGSGCGDMPHRHQRQARFTVRAEKSADGEGVVEYEQRGGRDWLTDENSASDGQ